MRLVLTQNVAKLGKKNELVTVKAGFGRNYLLPRGMATPATAALVKQIKVQMEAMHKRKVKVAEEAKKVAQTLKNVKLTFARKMTTKGVMYGSLSLKEIADELAKETKVKLDPESLQISDHIKKTGTYSVAVKLNEETDAKFKVIVQALKGGKAHK